MASRLLSRIGIVAAGIAFMGVAAADDIARKPPPPSKGFYAKYLTPRMDSRLTGEIAAATEFMDRTANPWTKDYQTVGRIEKGAFRATKSALKQYAIHGMKLDAWSVPLGRGQETGLGALRDDSGGVRLRFGISHLTPRADVLIPGANGRVVVTFDARGRLGTSFESHASNFSLGVGYDPSDNSGSFALTRRF